MRIYKDCYELVSEIYREVYEMGTEVHTDTYQNKVIKDDPNFLTKEIINYSYCLETLNKENYLYLQDPRMKEYVFEELLDRVSNDNRNPGTSYNARRNIWLPFLNSEGMFDYTYSERMTNNLDRVVNELKARPDSRQAVVSIWDAKTDTKNLGGKKRVPCSLHYQFLLRNEQLHIIYTMRSCDVMTHFGVDVALAWLLKDYVGMRLRKHNLNIKSGFLYHNMASLHCYRKDWDKLKKCIDEVKGKTAN